MAAVVVVVEVEACAVTFLAVPTAGLWVGVDIPHWDTNPSPMRKGWGKATAEAWCSSGLVLVLALSGKQHGCVVQGLEWGRGR